MTPQETFAIIITVAKEQRTLREWRNRQTRTFEGRVVIPYGFKSRLSHQTESGRNSRSDSFFLGSFVARDESPIPPTFPKAVYTLCGLLFLFWGLEPGRISALRKRFGESFLAESVRAVPHAKRGVTRASSMRCAAPQTVKSRLSHQKTAYTLCGLFFLFTGLEPGRVSALRKRFGESFLAESVRAVPHAKRGVTRASSMRCAAPQTVKSRLSHQKTAYTLCGLFFLFTGLVVGRVSALCRLPCKPPPKACAGSNMTE